ncbi:MAG TPA: 2-C-methyl-D-erythritol 4-phosphate cytidylyltransferase [candidate division Zixibacteria bacterium]|nr:2-C-methyl-D-erythritol 4-phosphate cytidylyltransferase [candidate division Zixibacteria bacterium]
MEVSAIIVAAGRGRRLGGKRPKAFVRVNGLPLVEYSLRTFQSAGGIGEIVLVKPAGYSVPHAPLFSKFAKLRAIVPGGAERMDSVRAGLAAVSPGAKLVLVHDAARPMVSSRDIVAVIAAARRYGAAVLAEPAADTIKRVEKGFIRATLNRSYLWRAQTPQGFRRDIIERAYSRAVRAATDDSSLAEAVGARVAIVPATRPNPKITTKHDLETAACLLGKRSRA